MMPQIAHNKADEIELEAMSIEGIGGAFYDKGSIEKGQLANIKNNAGKGGEYLEVINVNGIKERTGPKVPAVIDNYKEHKQRMIERITLDTQIQQGMKPGGVVAYSAIKELGNRADTKNKGKICILEDAQREIANLEISRIGEFYTEPRFFMKKNQVDITGGQKAQQDMVPGQEQVEAPKTPPVTKEVFSRDEMVSTWNREDEGTGEMHIERYIPEFNVKVKVLDEKPTDREYYVNAALNLAKMNLMGPSSVWYTLEEGKFPPKNEVLNELNQIQAQQQQVQLQQQQMNMQDQADKDAQIKQQEADKNLMMQFEAVMEAAGLNGSEKKLLVSAIERMPEPQRAAMLNADPNDQLKAVKQLIGEA
jgi:hypothetical protein